MPELNDFEAEFDVVVIGAGHAGTEAAVAAAERILSQETKGKLAGELIAKGIEDVRKKLN